MESLLQRAGEAILPGVSNMEIFLWPNVSFIYLPTKKLSSIMVLMLVRNIYDLAI